MLIIDEINRGNISNIFGELITLIEPSKRSGAKEALSVKLPYSKDMFSVPDNLHIIGTMNTADKSLAQIDIALRRRFQFEEMMTNYELLAAVPLIDGIDIEQMVRVINKRIELLYDREHTIGHSFFLPLVEDPSIERLSQIMALEILPLLEEYFFEDWERVAMVLGDHLKTDEELRFIREQFDAEEMTQLM
ncbi:AAA family ATPase, partial [Vibrio parahaemolyticus]|uniref:AAA family ATPase n=1 Tax=Vibrio parahaemolyticus TaxID=670 RepID=UPI0035C15F8D